MMFLVVCAAMVSAASSPLPAWTFDGDAQGWIPNSHLKDVTVANGALCATACDWDPFLTLSGLELAATPWQYVVLTIRASKAGQGELYWSGETTGQYGGLSPQKSTPFEVAGGGKIEDVVIFPFWHGEGTIRQLRLDLYNGSYFEISTIRVMEWGDSTQPPSEVASWELNGDLTSWRVAPKCRDFFCPPAKTPVAGKDYASVLLQAEKDSSLGLLWANHESNGLKMTAFHVRGDSVPRAYNISLKGRPGWEGNLAALGLRLPETGVKVMSVTLSDKPVGPADLVVEYFGFEDGVNRTQRPCKVMAMIANNGGEAAEAVAARIVLSPDLRFVSSTNEQKIDKIDVGERTVLRWTVTADIHGEHKVFLRVGEGPVQQGVLSFKKNPLLKKADYVPRPDTIGTAVEVCAYYFPGWEKPEKWDCIRQTAPIRKPLLGYYDESNPEIVDWQIKWARENGISCFLVDWYWSAGQQHLTHWFDAYRKCRYRDLLQVAIMWANHNAPNTHSAEDWRQVVRHWIDNYFNLPAYYKKEGKPLVFIWDPRNIRNDLGGSDAVKASMDEAQEMARQAGYPGISFYVVNSDYSQSDVETLLKEGYYGITNYHEWGEQPGKLKVGRYENVLKKAPEAWEAKEQSAGGLQYIPVIDTGWDSRPWHGDEAYVIRGRTPALFGDLCQKGREFSVKHRKPFIILGPVNEWGEGSYIEPCTEYGFDMLEQVRLVFGAGNSQRWPHNVSPADVGLGPYDFQVVPPVTAWLFDKDPQEWSAFMGIGNLGVAEGCLAFTTTSADPALVAGANGLDAAGFTQMEIVMLVAGAPDDSRAQLFWAPMGGATEEATSVQVPLIPGGQMQTYRFDLKANPKWKGRLSSLRFDPCNAKDAQVRIDSIRLLP